MKINIKISPVTRQAYFPKNLVEAGFRGEVAVLADASTAVLMHPNASLDEVTKSLQMAIEDIKIRKILMGQKVEV